MPQDKRTKAERVKDSDERHAKHTLEMNTRVATAANALIYEQKARSAYYLLNMISLWIKWPKQYQNMNAINAYAWRMNSGTK